MNIESPHVSVEDQVHLDIGGYKQIDEDGVME